MNCSRGRSADLLQRLGFDPGDRVVVVHADDLGFSQASVAACRELLGGGLVSSAAAMVPCPWFPEVVSWCRDDPTLDIGLRITLTSEWPHCRWRPVSRPAPDSGLVDNLGYLHPEVESLLAGVSSQAVLREMDEQVQLALRAGLQPSHIDAHMSAAMEKPFLADYACLGVRYGLPALVFRDGPRQWFGRESILAELDRAGLPIFDHRIVMPWRGPPDDRMSQAKSLFSSIPPGLSCLLMHPALDSPELRAMVPQWRYLVADHAVFASTELRDHVRRSGIRVIGYRALKDFMAGY